MGRISQCPACQTEVNPSASACPSCAVDLAKYNITVNSICPGLIETKMTEAFTSDKKVLERFMQPILIKRAGQPHDIASAALYLASEEASYVTGSEITVDGGWTAHL